MVEIKKWDLIGLRFVMAFLFMGMAIESHGIAQALDVLVMGIELFHIARLLNTPVARSSRKHV